VIRPSAMEAWQNLQFKLVEVDDKGERRPCRGREREYTEYDAFNVPSPGRAKMMCAGGCTAFAECHEYGEVAQPDWGVYGGVTYGKRIAEIERRERIRETTAGRRKREEA
jgi:hypothetical protein